VLVNGRRAQVDVSGDAVADKLALEVAEKIKMLAIQRVQIDALTTEINHLKEHLAEYEQDEDDDHPHPHVDSDEDEDEE
jgi:ribosomal protein S15P/S13E